METKRKQSGFTLIELLVVISIILILVTFIVPQIGGARSKARKAKDLNNLRVMGSALLLYADENDGSFPGNLADLFTGGFVGDPALFDNPSINGSYSVSGGEVTSDEYLYQPGLNDGSPGGSAIVACADGAYDDGSRTVLFVTGHVRDVQSAELGTDAGQVDLTNVTEPVGS